MSARVLREPTEKEIAVCAYAIWEAEGRPYGRDAEHWRQAREQLLVDYAHAARQFRKVIPAILGARHWFEESQSLKRAEAQREVSW